MARRRETRPAEQRIVALSRARAEFSGLVRAAAEGRATGITKRGELVT